MHVTMQVLCVSLCWVLLEQILTSCSQEPTGKSKGFCFVEYTTPEAAQNALDHMNGIMIAGR
jgi:RNA recognition motif-containing protein